MTIEPGHGAAAPESVGSPSEVLTPRAVKSESPQRRPAKPVVAWLALVNTLRRLFSAATAWALALASLFLAVLAGLWVLASPLNHAPFRLHVKTDLLWLVVGPTDVQLAFDASTWALHEPVAVSLSGNTQGGHQLAFIKSAPPTSGAPSNLRYQILVSPRAGDYMALTSTSVGLATPSMSVRFPERSVNTAVTASSADSQFDVMLDRDSQTRHEQSSSVIASMGGRAASRIELTPLPTSSARSTRFQIARIGFGQDEDVLRSGLLSGELYFLDLPSTEMKIFRGSDLRLEGVDLVVESLSITPAGLEVSISGLATMAAIRVGASGAAQASSMLPTNFDHAQRNPWLAAGIGALTLLISVVGLLLAAAQLYKRVALRIGADPPR